MDQTADTQTEQNTTKFNVTKVLYANTRVYMNTVYYTIHMQSKYQDTISELKIDLKKLV